MRDKAEAGGGYTAVGQAEGQIPVEHGRPSLAGAQQVLADAQHVLVDFIQARTDSGTEHRKKWVLVTMICGLCSITLGSLIIGFDPYNIIFKMKVIFSEDGETFHMWKKPEVNLYLKVTLFNITNAEDYMNGKAKKMSVVESGPYVYREYLEHYNATFNENGTITSYPSHPLEFQPHLSGGKEDDMLMLPNIALLSIAQVMSRKSFIARTPVNLAIIQTNTQPLVPMTAKEFMFGYRSKLLSYGYRIFPTWISFDKLGLIDRMYETQGGSTTTFTGETDMRHSGLYDNYNGKKTLDQWPFPCNNITGASDATKFNTLLQPEDTIVFFRKSLCRTVELVKIGDETIGGIDGYKYTIVNNSLDNGKYVEKNKCYCRKGKCLPVGLLDVSQCYYGFPITLSYPHFLNGDPALVEAFDGLKPDHENHKTELIVNAASGLPLKVSVKMQINMALEDISNMANCKRFSNMHLPMLWMDIEMPKLPAGMIAKFFIYLKVGPVLQEVLLYVSFTCGIAFILLSLSSSILIPRLMFDSERRFSSGVWVQTVPPKKRSGRLSIPSKEMETLLNGYPLQENNQQKEETSLDNNFNIC